MENRAGNPERDSGQPNWPQRPATPQPPAFSKKLEPPPDRANSANRHAPAPERTYRAASEQSPVKPVPRDTSKETRALPVIEPSRFERGGQPNAIPAVPVRPDQGAEPVRPQTKKPSVAQPQVRKPGGWQYERPDSEVDAALAAAGGQASRKGAKTDHSQSYLQVNIENGRKRHFGWLLWALMAIVAVILISTTAFALAWQGRYSGKIYSGVSAYGIDLSGKTPADAKKLLKDKVQPFVSQPIVLAWQNKEWKPSLEEIGVKVDVDSTVDEAFKVGRDSDMVGNVSTQWETAQGGYNVPLTVQLSEPALQTYLSGIASREIEQKLFEGDVRLNGDKIEAKPGSEGRSLRMYEAIAAIRSQVATLQPGKVDLPVETLQPSVTAQEVQDIQSQLAVRISSPITATAAGKLLTLDRDALIRFTTIQRNPDRNISKHIELGWKDNELKILADRWAGEAAKPAHNARFAWNNGAVAVLSESQEGFEPDGKLIADSIKEHASTPDKREYALPGKVLTPAVSSKDIGALGIKELMGTGTSTFKGSSPERATNIKVAADLLNGAVVPPGGTFSFLDSMGGIDEAHGFVEGYVIAAERTQKGVGGGVCQVSTTTFRAAFWSGMKITERNQHSYRVGWYEANNEPVGFDAAVFDPGVDLRFVNDTQSYVLVEAKTGPDSLVVNLYGTKIPGTVKLEGPVITNRQPPPPDVYQVDTRLPEGTKKQVETSHAGLDTMITRRIITPGQPDQIDKFSSSYKPWPNWYIVASPSQVPGGAKAAPNPTPNP